MFLIASPSTFAALHFAVGDGAVLEPQFVVRLRRQCLRFVDVAPREMNVIAQGDMSFNSGDDITLRGDKIFLN